MIAENGCRRRSKFPAAHPRRRSNPMLRLASFTNISVPSHRCAGVLGLLDEPTVSHRVILGAPGAGKSSLTRIRLLAWAEAPTDRPLPILVELRRFHHSRTKTPSNTSTGTRAFCFAFAKKNSACGSRLARQSCSSMASTKSSAPLTEDGCPADRAIRRRFPRAHILVTSRLIGYLAVSCATLASATGCSLTLTIRRLRLSSSAGLQALSANPATGPSSAAHKRRPAKPSRPELAGHPLLLTLMAVLARKSDLPRDLGSLYKQATDLLLRRWDARRYLATQVDLDSVIIDQKDKQDLLRDLAWKMQTGPQRTLGGNLIGDED